MSNLSLDNARHNMVVQQIRPWEVFDEHLLELIEKTPRDAFVPEDCRNLAYADTRIPLGKPGSPNCPEMMPPVVEARMLQALDIKPTDSILEIGTGSGYVTALLAKAGNHVLSVELHEELSKHAGEVLERMGIFNVSLEVGDAANGWNHTHGPYDVIAVTGSLPVLPEVFQQSLRVGGRLFVILGEAPAMEALLITRTGETEFSYESLFETYIAPLENAPQPERFVF
jgi:protein-L-isoaspartate(D-aspartate) O-methyltransferase